MTCLLACSLKDMAWQFRCILQIRSGKAVGRHTHAYHCLQALYRCSPCLLRTRSRMICCGKFYHGYYGKNINAYYAFFKINLDFEKNTNVNISLLIKFYSSISFGCNYMLKQNLREDISCYLLFRYGKVEQAFRLLRKDNGY